MSAFEEFESSIAGSLLNPMSWSVRVAVPHDLLIRHHPIAEAAGQILPIGFGGFFGLVDIDQVELGGHDLAGLVDSSNDQF